MIHFKIDNKEHSMPSLWQEVDVATFQRIAALDNDYTDVMSLIAAMLDMDRKAVVDSKAIGQMQMTAAMKLVADNQPLWDKIPFKDKFKYKDTFYKVPKNLEFERFGQKALAQIKLTDNDPSECIAYTIAVYMQPIIDGEFDDKLIAPLEKEILKMLIVDLYPLAYFFFKKLKEYKLPILIGLNPFP